MKHSRFVLLLRLSSELLWVMHCFNFKRLDWKSSIYFHPHNHVHFVPCPNLSSLSTLLLANPAMLPTYMVHSRDSSTTYKHMSTQKF
ncbi:hypothetical protein MPTK1_3g15100 [Marchantia polymorpha subsp. ruderalis]|uniref:Secreted protein n=2 Tax=Marchantia polymorpha TaxID=3197 RepID=A0AAF6B0Z4_MARPO|nr:hypothetical protein MARPO_0004s0162 [Marchantia polymorpha]BBN05678.1 hypothetical protein Mp_3g15100 [Marchantia polymorpha subsp. ruderalis]|eukprot:PTQ48904.1 hypothetical protein MARPO_0004s0162 [Marchantia polymorpha]